MAVRLPLRASWLFFPAAVAALAGACSGDGDTATTGGPGGTSGGPGGGGQGGDTSTATSTTGTGTATTGPGGGGGDTGCTRDADCVGDPGGAKCDVATGECVGCLPAADDCMQGQYCNPATSQCEVGCTDDTDCDPANNLLCDQTTNKCVGCLDDANCPLGSICVQSTCLPGCSPSHDCQAGFTCCGVQCFDLTTDELHCGDCNVVCDVPPNSEALCSNSQCGLGPCGAAFADCNLVVADGCEQNVLQDGPCVCAPGATQSCYQGAPGTEGVGPCVGGTETCNADGLGWGPCLGQVLPVAEVCANNVDEDCNGAADDISDQDGDGWTICNGDCCDTTLDCTSPELVNPGAFDVGGNALDDDCDGQIDNGVLSCDGGLASNSGVALDYAKAIDLCATTVENPPIAQKKWGVISANLFRANGAGTPAANSRAIRQGFGGNVGPLNGARIAVLSTGRAAAQAAPNNTNPAWAAFQGGQDMGTTSPVPADWLAANNNNFPNAPGCPDPQGGTTAHDPVMLKVRVRVPTNAKSFNVSSYFYSSEYPEWVCSAFNDFFLTLLDSQFVPGPGESPNPADKNLAFYDPPPVGGSVYPVGVNLAFGNTGLFNQCKNGPTGCGGGAVPGNTNSCVATTGLTGTGFDIANPPSQFAGDPGWCGTSNLAGGGTGWLTTSGNVKPGETIEVRFVIWDTGDQWYDSVVLLDNFVWSLTAAQPGTHN